MTKELEYIEELKEYIEYFTRLDYVEPIVRGEMHQKFKDIYWNKLPHLDAIEQALLKAEKLKKAWGIVKEYQVDIWLLKQCDYENYIRIRKACLVSTGQIINENGEIFEDEIPQQDFDFLTEVLE